MLRKCSHGNYVPTDMPDDESPYCSGCHPLVDQTIKAWRTVHERDHDETVKQDCPVCCSREFSYDDETSFLCPRCGFDQFSII